MHKTEPAALSVARSEVLSTRNVLLRRSLITGPNKSFVLKNFTFEASNNSITGGYFLPRTFDTKTKQQHQNCESCKYAHPCVNARVSVQRHAENNLCSKAFLCKKHDILWHSSCRKVIRNHTPVSRRYILALNGSSQLSPLKRQEFLNSHCIASHKGEKKSSDSQKAKFGSGSETFIQADGGSLSQSSETLLYDTVCQQSELIQAPGKVQQYLLAGYGWKVRDFDPQNEDDLRAVADIQATAFYTPFSIFNDFLFSIFKAEVLSALLYKIRHSLPKRYTCLLAEPVNNELILHAVSSKETNSKVVGVVDLTALGEREIVKHLYGTDEYLYLSGLAVESAYRRKSVATLLLQASDMKALDWGFKYLVLHAYEDDAPARRLYSRAGFQVICEDPLWTSKWLGRQRRVTMAKKVSSISAKS
ncbi:hypothetical protein O6H91_02G076800 [Diphasiastrum complanatum]|nr:hypothetical protein O6H91_02G076800 [Diphasiastrum complanatum]KAJ7565832.1 hypothetical protein O6H91_02G076800 [Diphasiastrum complanatum]